MRSSLLTSIARTIASTLVPSRINVEKDSLAKAISRKSSNYSISFKTESKLLAISNYSTLPKTGFDKDPESCTHATSVNEMKKQLQDASRETGGSRMKSRAAGDRIDRIVNSIEKRVRFAEDLWTQSYWKSRDGDTAVLQNQASTAVQRLGYKPEWKDYCLTQQVSQMAQELTIPAHAICRMQDAFHGIYRIPQNDAANSTPLTFTDFADPRELPDFVDLSVAAKDLRGAHALLPSFHDDGVRDSIERTLQDLGRILQSALEALLNRHEELVAKADDATEELHAIRKWLGAEESSDDASIDNDSPYENMSITEAFNAAAATLDLTDSQLKALEDRVVAMLALPNRAVPADAPYVIDDFPPLIQATEGTTLFSAQAELSNVAKALDLNPDNPSSPQLRALIEDLRARTGETVMYWLAKHASLDGGASNVPSPADVAEIEQIALHLGMAAPEASRKDSHVTGSSRPDLQNYIGAGAPATSPFAAAFLKLMGQDIVSDADVATVRSLFAHTTGIPAGEICRLDDFTLPEMNASFRCFPDLENELYALRVEVNDVEDEAVQERLTDLLDSLDETTQEAVNFMHEENQRLGELTGGFSDNWAAIELTWKWLEVSDAPERGDRAPEASTGDSHLSSRLNEVGQRPSQASHLFVQPIADQQRVKRQIFASDINTRRKARVDAMR